jgi:fucose 4-O-acetylase-like acetyltransferase
MSKRIEYLDIAKGIGILLVVLGHNDFEVISLFVQRLIYSFHMPLFFFLSGYFLNTAIPFFDFFKKRFNALLKPYLFTIFLIYFTSVSFEKMGFNTAIQRTVKSLYGSGYYLDWVQLWFLPQLFVVSLYAFLFIALVGKVHNRWVRWGILLATLGLALPFLNAFYPFPLSVLGKDYQLYGLPFSLDLVLVTGFFFILGYEMRQATTEKTFDNGLILPATGGIVLLLNMLFPYEIDFNIRLYESFLVNTTEAILGILFVLALARQIERRTSRLASVLKYLGNISLIILLFHVPIQAFWAQKVENVTGNFPLGIVVGFVMGVIGPILIYEIFIRFNPVASFWFGRKAESATRREQEFPEVKEERTVAATPNAPAVEIKKQ